MKVVLVSTYELGRQPFGVASPTAWLKEAGAQVTCLDLALDPPDLDALATADVVAFHIPMHTATRIAAQAMSGIRELNPDAHMCFFGLYASVNEDYLRRLGADSVLGGEFEEGLVTLIRRLATGDTETEPLPVVSMARQTFKVPDRSGLPQLDRYARLHVSPTQLRTVGYTEATRGCKHLCRHCPIVPVYGGKFRVVQRDIVLEDIRRQVAAGAEHITFGDPDFFNGPSHSIRLVKALHEELPDLTYDVTIKVEHLIRHGDLLPLLRDTGCLFVTSAVESMDPKILEIFDKQHTREEFIMVVQRFREVGLTFNPTFVTFTPWTTLSGYLELLDLVQKLGLVDNVAPIQYAIRLLVTSGSRLLELAETREVVGELDQEALVYPWEHPDPRVDELYEQVLDTIRESQDRGDDRRMIFRRIWRLARQAEEEATGLRLERADLDLPPQRAIVPYLNEPWYC